MANLPQLNKQSSERRVDWDSISHLGKSIAYGATAFACYKFSLTDVGLIYWPSIAISGSFSIVMFIEAITTSTGLGEMPRIEHRPHKTPRLDYDVNTGLPNHRATPERRDNLIAQAQIKQLERVVEWDHALVGAWDIADEIAGRPRIETYA